MCFFVHHIFAPQRYRKYSIYANLFALFRQKDKKKHPEGCVFISLRGWDGGLVFYYLPMTAFVRADVTDYMSHFFYISPNSH